ncbi:ammonia-dependent NAD(+) synthetase [Kocuria marina]|uniref:ammonia-dependent NAD(+) synthetase n=1 Tax=Kocuria marina TaxID=223184 RepID=UPI002989C1E9|nr:ammonia-dependent NAD(+) synthetase [Kocuria marina]MCT1722058.1 ammonia-dependent NAD(+) synthetase [Kocuria marina]MCT1735613.1 ammonia-dependent NAD(+) synthetase [Kocuria marina]
MRELQAQIVAELGVSPQIDPEREAQRRVDFLSDYLKATHTAGFVLGISGGVDSTLAGRLAQLAVEKLREDEIEAEFVAMRLPHGIQHDEADAQAALEFIQPDRVITYDVAPAVRGFESAYGAATGEQLTDFTRGNTKARVRMTAQYAVGGDHNLLVIGTDHAAESVTGFFTKFGDGGADVLPLGGLNKRQNRQVLAYLGASEQLVGKVPTADLLDENPGRTDEDELGLRYDDIDDFLEGKDVPEEVARKIESTFLRTRHKRTVPVTPADEWWREG